MAEEVKIIVKQESQGTALRDATEDAKKAQQAVNGIGAPKFVGSPPPVGAPAPVSAPIPAHGGPNVIGAQKAIAARDAAASQSGVSPERLDELMSAQGYEKKPGGGYQKRGAGAGTAAAPTAAKAAPLPAGEAPSPERLDALMSAQGYDKKPGGGYQKRQVAAPTVSAGDEEEKKKNTAREKRIAADAKAAEKADKEEERAGAAAKRKEDAAMRDKAAGRVQEQKQAIETMSVNAASERGAGGDPAEAAQLEKEIAIRRESLRLQQTAGIAEGHATAMATTRVEAEAVAARLRAEEAVEAKIQEQAEKEITRQKAMQAAESKLALKTGVQGIAGQLGGGAGGMAGGLMGSGPLAIAGLVAAVVGAAIETAIGKDADTAKARQVGAFAGARRGVIAGMTGGIGEQAASQNAQQEAAELQERKSKAGTFQNTSPLADWAAGFGNALSSKLLGKNLFETSGQKAERQNNLAIQEGEKNAPLSAAQALDKAKKGISGMEIEKTEAELRGQLGVARGIELKIKRQRDYEAALREVGAANEEQADDAQKAEAAHRADVKVMGELRNEAMKYGSLVNARSGKGDIARAAQGAQDYMTKMGAGYGDKLEAIHNTMKEQHGAVMNATRNRWGR